MADDTTGRAAGQGRWLRVVLVALPVWLALSGVAGVWWFIRSDQRRAREWRPVFARRVDAAELAADLRVLVEAIGSRGVGGAAPRSGLDRAAAWIDGTLGPSNTGFEVRRFPGPAVDGRSWPMLEVEVAGTRPGAAPVWVLAGYDAPGGGAEAGPAAAGVVAVLAAARELAGTQPRRGVRFLFMPHVFEAAAPLDECTAAAVRRIQSSGGAFHVLCIGGFGRGAWLSVATRDTTAAVREHLGGLGEVAGAEAMWLADDFDLASVLFEVGLPAARVAAGTPGESDSRGAVVPADLASAAGRMVDLIHRLALAE